MSRITMNEAFSAWAKRPEVQAAARQHILSQAPDTEQATERIRQLDRMGAIVGRGMNFGLITAMNALFLMFHHDLKGIPGVGNYADFNVLVMQPDPEWKQVFAIFGWSIGFRPEGELAPPQTGSPNLRKLSC